MKKLLTIAGSDSSGGAGIQADLKTFASLGTYGMSCICAVTAQNTKGVTGIFDISTEMIAAQLSAVYEDVRPDAVKTGMLSTPAITETVADFLSTHSGCPLVVDPVMVATSGDVLLAPEAIAIYKKKLIPLATVITPNLPEAEVLADIKIETEDDMKQAGDILLAMGPAAVLIKGGHREDLTATDFLCTKDGCQAFRTEAIRTENTHGTGCTLSSAIAAFLAKGCAIEDAVSKAKRYITGAIRTAATDSVGSGHGPVHHFWNYGNDWGRLP